MRAATPGSLLPVRIVWLAPWFRTLGVAWADGLRELGHDVSVISSEMHFDPPPLHADDVLVRHPWRSVAGAREFVAMRRLVRDRRPDVVVSEVMRDPRYLGLVPGGVPLALTTHDAVAHDAANRTPFMRRVTGRGLERRADLEVCFSRYVAREVGPRSHPVEVLPLTSEMAETATPRLVGPADRRDFYVVGRLSAYKNIATVIDAYRRHQESPAYRGDRLVLVGGGDPECVVPDDVLWERGRFRFADLAPRLAAAKASVCLYSTGSQSGVQVMSMQCGTACVVSDVGGLREYLPEGETPVPVGEPEALARRFDELADPDEAARSGARASVTYEQKYSVRASSLAWESTLRGMCTSA